MSNSCWQPRETAPKDGSVFLAHIGYPWAVQCVWNALGNQWIYPTLQVNMVEGEYNDPYFQDEYEEEKGLKAWMPMPEFKS